MIDTKWRKVRTLVVAVGLSSAMVLTGCSKSATTTATPKGNASGDAQQVQSSQGAACTASQYGATKIDLKGVTVGFSQSESTSNPFRATETKSIEDEATAEGIKLIERNANADVNAQNSQIEDMIAQGAKVLIVAPENSDGLAPALAQAKAAHIPVLTIDRTVTGTACSDFIAFIGSDFTGQAKIAADDLAAAVTNKTANVAILEGTSGNNVAKERTDGFTAQLAAAYPNMKVVADQTANFDETTGQKVLEQMLQSHPEINAVYAENDEMAFGAIQAIKSAGKVPGKDIMIVSIDGTQEAVQDVVAGTLYSDIETNPRFGPLAFQSLASFYGGTGVAAAVIIQDHHFTKENAADALATGQVY